MTVDTSAMTTAQRRAYEAATAESEPPEPIEAQVAELADRVAAIEQIVTTPAEESS